MKDCEDDSNSTTPFDIYLPYIHKALRYCQNWCGLLLFYPQSRQCEKPEKKGKANNSYVAQAYNAMCFYDKYFTGNTVIIGDFNSNAIWDNKKQRRVKHQALVRKLSNDNFSSVYHEMNDEQQGHETQPTLFFHHQKEKAYHIDYAFMHRSMFDNLADFRVGKHEEWGQKSDHMPLFLNLKDRAC